MTKADLVIHGGQVATDYGVFTATIVVRDGCIAALEDSASKGPAAECVIDARNKLVIPGGIDPHSHFWEPGPMAFREGYETGTRACAAGGITTVLEHPLSVPPTGDPESFIAKRNMACDRSTIDFGLWGALTPDTIDQMPALHGLGAVAFKGFMSKTGSGYPMVDDGALLAGLKAAREIGAIVAVHAENSALTDYFAGRLALLGRQDALAVAEGRPPFSEYEAINRAIVLAREAGAELHIVHMSIPEGVNLVRAARNAGVRVTLETCPHYLHFDWSALERVGPLVKCKPPLRSPESTERLWQAVLRGEIDFAASDHCPYTLEEKNRGGVWDAPWGMPAAQTMIPILISDGVIKRSWDLSSFVRFVSSNAASRFGIYGRKGTIRIGSDADVVVIDMNARWTIRREDLFGSQPWSPLEGETLDGRIEQTVVRGRVVYDRGKIMAQPGYGTFIKPLRCTRGS